MAHPTSLGDRAIVVGAGIAGLLSARVLSDWFDEVVLLDGDDIPQEPGTRSGVPQGKHFHALLQGGMQVASELFPGFADDLMTGGAMRAVAGDLVFYFLEGKSYSMVEYRPEPPRVSREAYVQTRGLLEQCVRKRVEALPNVVTRYRTAVRNPVVEGTRVAGVVVDAEQLTADLVIDAAGRASRCHHWLPQLGYEIPSESVVNNDFCYSSVLFRPEDPRALGGCGFFVMPAREGPYIQRGAALVRMEHDTWLCSLAGRFGDYPPYDMPGFYEYAKTLSHPILSELLGSTEPLTRPARYRYPRSVRRHFERLQRFPEGLLPIGDAICHYNPIYGQGMSAAARQAMALLGLLAMRARGAGNLQGIAFDWFPMAYEEIRGPWAFAAAADFQNPLTTGDFPVEEMPSLQMAGFLMEAARTDVEAEQLIMDVFTLTKPLTALLEPPWPERLAAAKAASRPTAVTAAT